MLIKFLILDTDDRRADIRRYLLIFEVIHILLTFEHGDQISIGIIDQARLRRTECLIRSRMYLIISI